MKIEINKYNSLIILMLLLVQFTSCQSVKEQRSSVKVEILELAPAIEQTDAYFGSLRGKRVGVVANGASVIGGIHLIDSLVASDINVAQIFTPEHGLFSKKSDGEHLSDITYKGIQVSSLYGKNRKPQKEDVIPLDVILFDLQDVGLRFYTYISTLHYIIEVCAEHNKDLIVLDRPNPFIQVVDGPVLKEGFSSFVGMHKVPVIYGMTIGEYAQMIVGEDWTNLGVKPKLKVVEISNYKGSSFYTIPIAPSPNLPNHQAIMNYPNLCFFEGTEISVGRGTNKPFQILGHPDVAIGDDRITPRVMESSKWPKHQDRECLFRNIDYKTDIDTNILDLTLLFELNHLFKQSGLELINRVEHFDRISGTDKLRLCLEKQDCDFQSYKKTWKEDLDEFHKIRVKYLIYDRNK